MITIGAIGPWALGIDAAERSACCRELRALALVYLGRDHPLTVTLGEATDDAAVLEAARAALASAPALQRRRLLASYLALQPDRRRAGRPRTRARGDAA